MSPAAIWSLSLAQLVGVFTGIYLCTYMSNFYNSEFYRSLGKTTVCKLKLNKVSNEDMLYRLAAGQFVMSYQL